MNDEAYRDMVIDHDKHIDKLTTSVDTLASSVKITHKKFDDLIDVITHQNVLQEKFSNLDNNFKNSHARLHGRIDELEIMMPKKVSWTFVQWLSVIVFLQTISFGVYTFKELHRLDNLATEKIHMQRGINLNVQQTLERLEGNNYE